MPRPNRRPDASTSIPSPSACEVKARDERAIGRRHRQQKKEEQDAAELSHNTATVSESGIERRTRSKKKDVVEQPVEATTNRIRTTPEGLHIKDAQGHPSSLTVGKMIGKGSEKEVYELSGSNGKWACKIVKGTDVINAKAHWDEYQLLNGPLKSLQGSIVPSIPSVTDELSLMPYVENFEGYNIAVVARMNAELLTGVPAMVDEARARGETAVNLSKLATRLIDMCEALHKEGYVNVDIKPQNLMVDQQGTLCFIDFGLAQEITPMGENPFGAGTPAFMALSAHTTSPSPREDIESMIYLLADLLLRIQAAIRGEQLKPTDDTYLPWDLAAEEEEVVLEEKIKHVKDFESTFYKSIFGDAAQCIKRSLELNWQCRYDDMPEYEEMRQILSSLKVSFQETPSTPVVAVPSKVDARILRPRQSNTILMQPSKRNSMNKWKPRGTDTATTFVPRFKPN
jgi:serine/threonine protein kinase